MAAKKKQGKARVLVRKGQVYQYRANRIGAHLKFFKVVGVSRGQQPKASYRQITKSGNRVPRKHKWDPILSTAWLTWDGTHWVFPFGQLVEECNGSKQRPVQQTSR